MRVEGEIVARRGKKKDKKLRILVFGNPLVKEDALPLELLPDLQREFPNLEFVEFDAAEDLEKEVRDGELLIIDSVKGLDRVRLITDIGCISTSKIYTMHDFDLGMTLKLLKKMGMLKGVKIFGVPTSYGKKKAMKELKKLLGKFLKSLEERNERFGWMNVAEKSLEKVWNTQKDDASWSKYCE